MSAKMTISWTFNYNGFCYITQIQHFPVWQSRNKFFSSVFHSVHFYFVNFYYCTRYELLCSYSSSSSSVLYVFFVPVIGKSIWDVDLWCVCVPGVRHVKFLRGQENFESSLSLVQFLRRHRDPGISYRRGQFPPGCPGSRRDGTGHKSSFLPQALS